MDSGSSLTTVLAVNCLGPFGRPQYEDVVSVGTAYRREVLLSENPRRCFEILRMPKGDIYYPLPLDSKQKSARR
jgi:hypothetical protein